MSSAARPSTGAPLPSSTQHERSYSHSRQHSLSLPRPASRASGSGILTPTHDAELNLSRGPGHRRQSLYDAELSESKKRKRPASALATDSLLKNPIVMKPHPSSLTVKPCLLHPLMLLPRESLPLSALDLAKPHGDLPPSRLFESKIKILDLEGRLGSNVLLARSETTRMVYAVERESTGFYVLCKLGSWVDIEALGDDATVVCRERMRITKPIKVEDTAGGPIITPQMYKENKRRKLAIDELQSHVARKRSGTVTEGDSQRQPSAFPESRPASRGPESQDDVQATDNAIQPPTPHVSEGDLQATQSVPGDDPLVQPTAENIMDNLRAQYFEALYHSKGSLAYFAKGPLSRARAAFHLNYDSNLEMIDLVEFLKNLVITAAIVDKKYRETVPAIVEKMRTTLGDSDNQSQRKKRKPKKPKLGKDGLYPAEVDHVKHWWTSHLPVANDDEEKSVSPTEVNYHISCLRTRETQLQMILILEILALEPLTRPKEVIEDCLPGMESRSASREASQEPAASKKKTKHHLPTLLDVHADRMCIWQSITLDEVKALAESQAPTESEKPERVNSDPLKDFCVDIIVPFYSARLPELCDTLNRKLGGPVTHSPPKKEFAKPAVSTKARPGAPAKRPAALKNERSLERALSNERLRRSVSREPSKAIALMRSASSTTIPGLKREGSEPLLLGMIPRTEKSTLKEKLAGSFPRAADSRAKKQAQVDAELRDAISALKKPNRALAVKELVDAAEKRASGGLSQLKKLKKPTRSPAVVKATPANSRFKDALASENSQSQPRLSFEAAPPSSASIVPASTMPGRFINALATSSATARFSSMETLQATPARRPTLSNQTTLQAIQETPGIPASSPIVARKAPPAPAPLQRSSGNFLSVPRGGGFSMDLPSSPGLTGLFETPVNPKFIRNTAALINDTPIKSRLPTAGGVGGGVGEEKMKDPEWAADVPVKKEVVSIYERLGWDDDDEL
ncbi:DNA replication regulator SLD3-domain-containing protein [Podospora australis]|uniref:DNA replication regulator SLD3-domain-containing protein n=1 Tax=Podospora australis TaxID=1536484 RepID=A0AAN7AKH2_9PEZI|nr:DNA replication regulator SLD3-domain-containing protein [Podospora australis]